VATLSISKQQVSDFTEQEVEALAERLEQDNYNNPFEALEDWHLLRAIAFQRPDLAEKYIHLLDIETYDEA
jgi:cytochrome c-type biogenesis protein CcmH/NrfG